MIITLIADFVDQHQLGTATQPHHPPSMAPKKVIKKPAMKPMKKDNVLKTNKKQQQGHQPEEPANTVKSGKGQSLSAEALKVKSNLSCTSSLDEKLKLLKDANELSPQEKFKLLGMSLTHPELNKLNGRFKTAAKNVEDLKAAAKDSTNRSEHRTLVAAFALDPSKGTVFNAVSHALTSKTSIIKVEKPMSRKQALEKWTEEELDACIESGRVIQKPDPLIPRSMGIL